MRAPHSTIKIVVIVAAVLVTLGIAFAVWEFGIPHRIARLQLGEHQVRLEIDYHYDLAHDVLCELSGPRRQHPAQIIAFMGAAESSPVFTVHQATNRQVFWITADTHEWIGVKK